MQGEPEGSGGVVGWGVAGAGGVSGRQMCRRFPRGIPCCVRRCVCVHVSVCVAFFARPATPPQDAGRSWPLLISLPPAAAPLPGRPRGSSRVQAGPRGRVVFASGIGWPDPPEAPAAGLAGDGVPSSASFRSFAFVHASHLFVISSVCRYGCCMRLALPRDKSRTLSQDPC